MIGQLLERAAPLAAALPGRLAWETRLTWLAADRVRRGLQRRGAAVQHRCRLGAMDRALLLLGLLAGRGR